MRRVIGLRRLVYKLVVPMVVVVLCMACGGEGDSPPPTDRSTPPPTVDSPATPTAPPPASTPRPNTTTEPTGELRPDILEFVDAFCGMRDLDFSRETWGDVGNGFQISIEYLQSLDTPEELEGMISALQARYSLDLDFVRGQDSNEPVNFDEIREFRETAEAKALEEAYYEEVEAVDPEIFAALNEC